MKLLNKRQVGTHGEKLAMEFLINKGYRLIEKNYRTVFGEIDLIMRNRSHNLVFVEVKMALTPHAGPPEFRITGKKQRQLGRMAYAYFQGKNILQAACQFDVVAIENYEGNIRLKHYVNAFLL